MTRIADDAKAIKAALDRIEGKTPSGRQLSFDGTPLYRDTPDGESVPLMPNDFVDMPPVPTNFFRNVTPEMALEVVSLNATPHEQRLIEEYLVRKWGGVDEISRRISDDAILDAMAEAFIAGCLKRGLYMSNGTASEIEREAMRDALRVMHEMRNPLVKSER